MVAKESRSGCMDDLSIALVMFEGAEEQDVVGPLEMFYWMSLFEALPPDRRPVGEPDFAVDFISESEFANYFYPKVPPKAKVFTVAPTIRTYRMSSGMQWAPDFSHDNAPRLRTWSLRLGGVALTKFRRATRMEPLIT